MDFGSIFRAVSGVLDQDTRRNDSVDTDGLIGQIGNIFRQHGANDEHVQNPYAGQGGYGGQNVLPASQDPYGDPADQGGYQQQGGNILPASQDPYGDPADQR
jgi:hypothetical protein